MKLPLYIIMCICFFSNTINAQIDLISQQPKKAYENIFVQKLNTDSNSTSFVIWIKKHVPLHKHEYHTEVLYIISGQGILTIDGKAFDAYSGMQFTIFPGQEHEFRTTSIENVKVLSVQSPEFYGKDRVFIE